MEAIGVSVVIVTYDSAEDISRCLQALLGSEIRLEVVVVDNASVDESASLAKGWLRGCPGSRLIENEVNLGFAKAVNLGIKSCTGQYIVVLNPDCFVRSSTLRELISVMEADQAIGLSGSLLLNEDGTEQAGCRRYLPTPWRALMRVLHLQHVLRGRRRFYGFLMSQEPMPDKPVQVEALSGALLVARRTAMEEVGLLDEGYFMHCEDLDWCVRFQQAGWKVVFVPNACAIHRKGGSSKFRPIRVEFHKHRGMVRFYGKFFRHRYPGALMWLVLLAVWARFAAKAALLLPKSTAAFLRKRLPRPAVAEVEGEIKLP